MNAPILPEHLSQLLQLYMAVGYEDDPDLDPHERQTAVALLRRWMPGVDEAAAEAVVDTARTASRSGVDVDALARDLRQALTPAARRRVVSDLGQIARADGHLSVREARAIQRIRWAWGGTPARS